MKKILLIEDDSNYIWHIKNFLQRKGYHVLVAFTVSQGKELIEKEQILIIGSDLKLSDGSGMELLEYLREKTYKIPFLFFTCYDKKYYEKEALEKGAKICMNKLQFDLVKETLLEYAYKESNGEGATFHKILLVKKNSEITSIIQTELLKKGIYGFKWNQLGELYQWFTDTYAHLSLKELMGMLDDNIQKIFTMIDSMTEEELFLPHKRKWADEATKTAVWEVYKFIHVNTVAPFGTFRTKIRKWKKLLL